MFFYLILTLITIAITTVIVIHRQSLSRKISNIVWLFDRFVEVLRQFRTNAMDIIAWYALLNEYIEARRSDVYDIDSTLTIVYVYHNGMRRAIILPTDITRKNSRKVWLVPTDGNKNHAAHMVQQHPGFAYPAPPPGYMYRIENHPTPIYVGFNDRSV